MASVLRKLKLMGPALWGAQPAEYRRYKKSFDGLLARLFAGFPDDDLSYAKELADYPDLVHFMYNSDGSLEESALLACATLIGLAIAAMPATQRQSALSALSSGDNNNRLANGIVHMLEVARSVGAEADFEMLGYEIVGRLRGMDSIGMRKWRTGRPRDEVLGVPA